MLYLRLELTTSQQQALKLLLPVLFILLDSGWFPKKYRPALKIAIGVLQAIAGDEQDEFVLDSVTKAALLERAQLAQQHIGLR